MPINVIVVTPAPTFGENMRRSLEESGEYSVHLANNKATAVVRADEESCVAAFLDFDFGEERVADIGISLRTIIPNIELFVLCNEETPPALDKIRPWTLVRKPFQSADPARKADQTPSMPQTAPLETEVVELAWLNDVTKAAQHLTRLTLESSSQAALITRGRNLWAYAGQLSQEAANEVAKAVARSWDGQEGSDLLRFIRLESTKAEHMLFATQLAEGVILAMVFDAETPFSTIRSQASQLVTSLEEGEAGKEKEKTAWPNSAASSGQEAPAEVEQEEPFVIPPISDILSDVPTPDPAPQKASPKPAPAGEPKWPGETRRSIFGRETSAPIPVKDLMLTEQAPDLDRTLPSRTQTLEDIDVTAPSKSQPRPETPVRKPARGGLDQTRPNASAESAGRIVLEPVSAGVYHLAYACLLVPRFSSHYMTGDLADRISDWLPNICIAFGWRLEHLAVRPEYFQWVVNVPPATSPGYLMRIVRQQTSEKIFNDFARLKKENPSGDFWAPGYLIMGGTQPHPPQLVKDYIKQIRQRQGIEYPRK